jgi:LysR family transcriptional regulator, regulator for metE and metH
MLNLEVRHLLLVKSVAETGSLTKAGERLNLTQSALSHQLVDLERRLGTQLFHRVSKRMRLTAAGERVLASADRVLGELAHAEEEVRLLAKERRGLLRFTVECYTAYHWLPDLLQRFRKRHAGVDVRIDANATHRVLAALLEGTIDLALLSSPVDDRRIATAPLFDDEIVAVMAPDHPLARREHVTASDLAGETIMTYPVFERSSVARELFAPAGVKPRATMQIQLTEAAVELARGGIGVATLPRWSVTPQLASGVIAGVRIGRRGLIRHWKAATLRDAVTPGYVEEFIELLAAMPAKRRNVPRYAA